ncbi:MAG: phage Gp37/Gp68 family protein [Hyphomicrobium sp.]|jgi:protein gp37
MSANTKIEWADHTFNPWIGCTKVGPGCDNCYAKADFEDRKHRVTWGAGQARSRTKTWGDPVRWNKQHLSFGIKHGRKQRVFCASLADVFDNEVPQAWRDDLFRLISVTPHLDWLLLTKRIGNANVMIGDALLQEPRLKNGECRAASWPWPNVWLGATICNQEEADRDIPKLLALPAAQRFLSMEPLLGPVDLGLCDCDKGSRPGPGGVGGVTCPCCHGAGGRMVDWIIVGGESGPNARPMHPNWVRSLRDQCQSAVVPFLFKQWGEWLPAMQDGNPDADEQVINASDSPIKVGKKAAGRLLDGREWNGVPT